MRYTVDNDVNLMALGEATHELADAPLLFIKVGAGIGAGIVTADGNVHRGADGAAGDIGHIRISTRRNVVCRCGKLDCLEAVASHRAVLADLGISQPSSDDGLHASRELARRVSHNDAEALHRIRQAAADIGEVVAMLIHNHQPADTRPGRAAERAARRDPLRRPRRRLRTGPTAGHP
jgi:predicted NBD/HSP70 family sugar kinase